MSASNNYKASTEILKRDDRLDALKGFLIISVVLGHFNLEQFIWRNTSTDSAWFRLAAIPGNILPVNYYHVPLFLALSVLFVKDASFPFFKKRFLGIVIPFLFWTLKPSIFFSPFADIQNAIRLLDVWLWGNWHYVGSILWFLPALFSTVVIYSIFKFVVLWAHRNLVGKFVFVCIVIAWCVMFENIEKIAQMHVDGFFPWGIDIAFYLLPYVAGIEMVYRNRGRFLKFNAVPTVLVLIAVSLLAYLLIQVFEPVKTIGGYFLRIDIAQLSVPYTLPGLVGMFLLSATILLIFLRIPCSGILSLVGRHTMPIYLMHYYFLTSISRYSHRVLSHYGLVDYSAILFIVTIVVFVACISLPIFMSVLFMKFSRNFRYIGMQ